MFQSSQRLAILGGRQGSPWDRSFTVRKAPVFHGRAFDRRLFRDNDPRDTPTIVRALLASEDALDPLCPCHVFLRDFLLTANYSILTAPQNPTGAQGNLLAMYDDRRERDSFQDPLRNWADPIYQNGPPGVGIRSAAVDERGLYRRLTQKVGLSFVTPIHHVDFAARRQSS